MAKSDAETKQELNAKITRLNSLAQKKKGSGGVERHLKMAQMAVIRSNFQEARKEIAEAERQLNNLK